MIFFKHLYFFLTASGHLEYLVIPLCRCISNRPVLLRVPTTLFGHYLPTGCFFIFMLILTFADFLPIPTLPTQALKINEPVRWALAVVLRLIPPNSSNAHARLVRRFKGIHRIEVVKFSDILYRGGEGNIGERRGICRGPGSWIEGEK